MIRKEAFEKINAVLCECDWKTAVEVLASLLATVIVLGPVDTPERTDAFVDALAADIKDDVHKGWPERAQYETVVH